MKLFTFKGGVHPPYRKELVKDKPIQKVQMPKQLVVPLVQHIGAPCAPAVEVGELVKEGQIIGKSDAFVSAPIHSPASGKVVKIERALHPLGGKILSVIVAPDNENRTDFMKPMGESVEELNPQDMLKRIVDAGIVGMGGATFPSHVKFSPPKNKPIDTLIINGCECEPYLAADHRLMLERTQDIILGARIIGKILNVKTIIIAVEINKPDALEKLETEARQKGIDCVATATKYPQGGEKMLIKAVLNREVPSGGLPMDIGAVVSNVGTAVAVCEAVRDGKPLIDRVVSVTGDAVKNPANLLVKIGTPVKDIVEQVGGTVDMVGKMVLGGPMMGIAQSSFEVPVIKGTSGILILKRLDDMSDGHRPCIKCSFCIQACPTNLMPSTLSIIAEAGQWRLAEKYGVNDCIECGSCAYECPSKRPIVQLIKTTKAKLREIHAREKK